MPRSRTPLLLAVAALAAVSLASCAPEAPTSEGAPSTPPAAAPAPTAQDPAATPQPIETGVPADEVTCETLVLPSTRETFESSGWSVEQADLTILEDTLAGGIECTWADFSIQSNDRVVLGWAPVAPDVAVGLQDGLEAEGWLREDEGETVYLTEPNPLTVDENGYGYTYEFSEGWVAMADWKANLPLIETPIQ